MICTSHQSYVGSQLKKNEMDGACGVCGGEERCKHGFGGENLRERDHLEYISLGDRILLKWILR
jgi:hypothetical protein